MSFFLNSALLFVVFILVGYLFRRRVLTPLRQRAEDEKNRADSFLALCHLYDDRHVELNREVRRLEGNVSFLSLELTKANENVKLLRKYAEHISKVAEARKRIVLFRAQTASKLRARLEELEKENRKLVEEPVTTLTLAERARRLRTNKSK